MNKLKLCLSFVFLIFLFSCSSETKQFEFKENNETIEYTAQELVEINLLIASFNPNVSEEEKTLIIQFLKDGKITGKEIVKLNEFNLKYEAEFENITEDKDIYQKSLQAKKDLLEIVNIDKVAQTIYAYLNYANGASNPTENIMKEVSKADFVVLMRILNEKFDLTAKLFDFQKYLEMDLNNIESLPNLAHHIADLLDASKLSQAQLDKIIEILLKLKMFEKPEYALFKESIEDFKKIYLPELKLQSSLLREFSNVELQAIRDAETVDNVTMQNSVITLSKYLTRSVNKLSKSEINTLNQYYKEQFDEFYKMQSVSEADMAIMRVLSDNVLGFFTVFNTFNYQELTEAQQNVIVAFTMFSQYFNTNQPL